MTNLITAKESTIPCCPPLAPDAVCDVLDFHYRLNYPVTLGAIGAGLRRQTIPVEVKLHFRLTRCRGPLAIGDLIYTTTLLPGEKVRLFTSDRRTRFTYDSSTQLAYRNTQSSEESYYMQSMSDSLFDTNSRDETNSSNRSHAHVDGHGDAGIDILGLGGSANMSGNFDSDSVAHFLGEHSQHAEASHHAAEMGTRKAASVSVGEVQSRTHTETSSEDHFESASREFSNPNNCHAVMFLFYQINKTQTVKYTLESIEQRVILDPDNDFTKVALNPVGESTGVGITSSNVLATDDKRKANYLAALTRVPGEESQLPPSLGKVLPSLAIRTQALKQVDKQLMDAGLLDKDGQVSAEAQKRYSFEKQSSLPTPGLLVKGCLDDCDICEPALKREIELDLEHKKLENELLKRKTELLEKSQEYRCCPAGATEPEP